MQAVAEPGSPEPGPTLFPPDKNEHGGAALSAGTSQPVLPWSLYSAWQRHTFLGILFLVATSNYFDYFVLSVLLEPIKQEFHVSDSMLGLLSGSCFSLFYGVAALPIARWADRGNRRTVITVALASWSAMTAICGLAQSFWQLAAARLGVGAAEPGALPPAQSLIADYFPPSRRALAIAMLTQGGSAAGWLVGVVAGGYVASQYGWRLAFILAGAPGLILAVIVRLVLREPRSVLGFPGKPFVAGESIRGVFSHLKSKPSYLFVLLGLSVYALFSYGVSIFLPSFMIRVLHATLTQVSSTWGFTIAAANLVGALLGGWLADRLSKRDVRWYGWLPAIGCLLGAPLYWLALSARHLTTFISINFVAELVLAIGTPASFVAIHSICGNRRRVMAIAIALFLFTMVGSSIGPLAAGLLSDSLSPLYGQDSLRYSLIVMSALPVPAALAFWRCSRTLQQDQEM